MVDLDLNPKYYVEIPYRKELGGWPFYQYDMELSPLLRQWFSDNIHNKWLWTEIHSNVGKSILLRFYFNDTNDALLFKLAWGGE